MSDGLVQKIAEWSRTLDERGELRRSVRQQIKAWLETTYGRAIGEEAWQRLELASAEHVVGRWQEAFTDDHAVNAMIKAARARLDGASDDSREAHRRLAELKTLLDDRFELGEEFFVPIYAGFAVWAAVSSAMSVRQTGAPHLADVEIEPEQWDAAFYASLAEAGGAVWEDGVGDDGKRRLYWTWYLESALPEVMRSMTRGR